MPHRERAAQLEREFEQLEVASTRGAVDAGVAMDAPHGPYMGLPPCDHSAYRRSRVAPATSVGAHRPVLGHPRWYVGNGGLDCCGWICCIGPAVESPLELAHDLRDEGAGRLHPGHRDEQLRRHLVRVLHSTTMPSAPRSVMLRLRNSIGFIRVHSVTKAGELAPALHA